MALIDLCRLCIVNCSTIGGIFVYPSDNRRDKIRDCLSIIVSKKIIEILIFITQF